MSARVILLCGPSGSGKSRIAAASGLPVIRLGDAPAAVAEGVLAAEIVEACRGRGILADAVVLGGPRSPGGARGQARSAARAA